MDFEFLADYEEQIPTLARWFHEEWSYLHPDRTLSDFAEIIAKGCNKGHLPISLVAVVEGNVVGVVSLKVCDFKARTDLSPWLASLYVDKAQRCNGIGEKLVHDIERLAAQLGESRIYLVTDDAEIFYTRLGWRVRERVTHNDHAVAVMEKEVPALT